ncbi:hypothetical protein C8R44DRAFT_741792 [Mycena epipterygia]|nr:hypothetical protein C8R44DRAFT_741792 [Mycena epipterygia]
MSSETADAVRFNQEAGELFKLGQYDEAAKRYQAAIIADTSNSPVYFSNLSAVYMKVAKSVNAPYEEWLLSLFRQIALAETAAQTALIRDPRSIKARYRRALARNELGRLAEALVDLASLLTTSPTNEEGLAAFQEISASYAAGENPRISLQEIVDADFPSAFGSHSLLKTGSIDSPSIPSQQLPVNGDVGKELAPMQFSTCRTCKTTKSRKDIKTCQKCKRATYCNAACQKADWFVVKPSHKTTCNRQLDINLTMRLIRELTDDPYIRTHLSFYAARALGLLDATDPSAPASRLLLVMVDTIPVATPDTDRQRLRIKHLLAPPLAVLPPEIVKSHTETMFGNRMLYRGTPLVGVCIATSSVKDRERRYRVIALPVPPEWLHPGFSIRLSSHSFGDERAVTMDLDSLYAGIEDELRLDVDNHYKLQG